MITFRGSCVTRWLIISSSGWLTLVATLLLADTRGGLVAAVPQHQTGPQPNLAAGLTAFAEVASVLRSPRCINCHPAGDVPRQTDFQQPHFPPVARGSDGRGVDGMRCGACHQGENQSNGVPGAPNWGVAPRSMAWAGLNDHELSEQLKDPNRNGHRTLEQMIEHIRSEPLVRWAWQPGGGRQTPPLTHERFLERFKVWVAAGAPSPESTKE